jgi:dihydroxyacetone kinase
MKKFMNSTETMLRESLSGFAQCHRDIVALDRDFRFVSRKHVKRGKVALISGGGSGHEPLHTGFVGYGMLDAGVSQARCSPRRHLIRWWRPRKRSRPPRAFFSS